MTTLNDCVLEKPEAPKRDDREEVILPPNCSFRRRQWAYALQTCNTASGVDVFAAVKLQRRVDFSATHEVVIASCDQPFCWLYARQRANHVPVMNQHKATLRGQIRHSALYPVSRKIEPLFLWESSL
jgi:hypothetical protein